VSVSRPSPGRSGRRRGPTQSRDAIADAARAQFAELGYDRATIRGIAAGAGVDPALVVHFFGSKEALFREVMALPPEVGDRLASLADGPRESLGRRVAEIVVALLETPASRAVVLGRIRSATSHPDAAAFVRETVTRDLGRLTAGVTDDRPDARAVLVGSQVVGIVLARHVVRLEPLASMAAADLVDLLAPTFQHYLVEPLVT
jgi:AcrR family transcriptional regulator